MSAFIAFIVILFAPVVGVEPGFIDDAASRAVLEPKWVTGAAVLFGALVELGFLWWLHRARPDTFPRMLRAAVGTYSGALILALPARIVLGSRFLAHVIVARGGRLTSAGWLFLVLPAAVLLLGGTFVGAFFLSRWLTRGQSWRRAVAAVAGENAVSLAAVLLGLWVFGRMR